MPTWAPALASGTVGVVAILFAWFFRRLLGKWDHIAPVFVLTGTMCLLGTGVGQVIQHGVTLANTQMSAKLAQVTGIAIPFLVAAIAAMVFFVNVFHHKRHSHGTMAAAAILPIVGPTIPGIFGSLVVGGYGVVGYVVSALVGGIFGIH